MTRRILAAAFVLALAVPAMADDKVDAKKLKGNWLREVQGTKLLYKFKDDGKMEAQLTPQGADKAIIVSVDYTVEKDGVLSGVITKVENGGDNGGPQKGDKFSMKIEVGKETLIVSDFKGVEGAEVKQLVEGEYKRQTD
jgi:hypothetical protein